jgi:hypothetical protein
MHQNYCLKLRAQTIPQQDGFYYINGQQQYKKTTAGWKLLVKFSDGTTDWI